jgi:hypothetical protein
VSRTDLLDYEDAALGCPTCGLAGKHKAPPPGLKVCATCPCIAALRDVIATIQLRGDKREENVLLKQAVALAGANASDRSILSAIGNELDSRKFGGRIVMLDGERVSIATAADRHGMTCRVLYLRVRRFMDGKTVPWESIDLRQMGVLDSRQGKRSE